MKKIFSFFCLAVTFISCSTPKQLPPPPPVVTAPMGRQPVESVEGTLILQPVKSMYPGSNRTYYSFYDYPNKYMYLTDQDSVAENIRTFLPEEITKSNAGYEVTLQSVTVDPYASLTQDVRDKIKEVKGIEFNSINTYQIAKSFNIKQEKNSPHAQQSLLSMLENGKMPDGSQTKSGRSPITGAQGLLTYHPIKNLVRGNNGRDYYFFLDRVNKYIYVTDNAELYEKISSALPMQPEKGKENAVILQGIAIDPIILFKPEVTEAMEKDQGFELNGGATRGYSINNYTLATIDNYAIVKEYKSVIADLREKLKVTPQANQSQTNRTPQQNVPIQTKPTTVTKPPVQNSTPAIRRASDRSPGN